jgi:YidC/Oxa1 family membrane protein insertase
LSVKQARGAKKMKELQPKIAELRKKYENDKEKLARAQMELFSKENYNPLAGCLPIFLQLPIFIGLYTALNSSVDLRMAPFLWMDNLAGPDALFRMPFSLPFLGQDFNLLPIVTVVLFVIQQKMFMPPPTDEQQEMQQRMMMWMSIIFGFFFYHLPSGLCVYFIASSLWGLSERRLLDFGVFAQATTPSVEPPAEERKAKPVGEPATPRKQSWLGRLLESADAAASDAGATGGQGRLSKQLNGARDKRKKSRPR